jgi:hypothetical protein
MLLNDKIQAYLINANITFVSGDYQTGEPNGEPDQILFWDEKLGVIPTAEQLTAAFEAVKNSTQAAKIRIERNTKLSESDWTQVADAPVDKAAWATYRQALRDVTKQSGFPWTIDWPLLIS